VILTDEAARRNRSMGVADMGVAGFGGEPASRKVATLARSPLRRSVSGSTASNGEVFTDPRGLDDNGRISKE